jgi:hypothetical protein
MALLWEPSMMRWSTDLLQRQFATLRTPVRSIEISEFLGHEKAREKIRASEDDF